ncbi:hypothetical protein [Deinococcus humi]|uniref:Uncharacterized protein n=1 Tax=Deinococcus humi TaxID=662880 RepID=A0A7W8K1S6_9DEIO|nr:hypothetical protein [Deinococcus humi]MBB5365921.1 hypothetical protein [Deinococcus humi]
MLKFLLQVLWALVKAGLFVVEAIFAGLDGGRKVVRKEAASWGQHEPPHRDRTSAYYTGPGRKP